MKLYGQVTQLGDLQAWQARKLQAQDRLNVQAEQEKLQGLVRRNRMPGLRTVSGRITGVQGVIRRL